MTVNIFEFRTLLKVVENQPRAKAYLRDKFFSNVQTFNTKTVDIDIVDEESRKLAPFSDPKSGGSLHYREGYRVHTYQPAYIAPKIPTTAEDALNRLPGENIYQQLSPEQHVAKIVAENLQTLDRLITRREEYMAAQALFEGKIAIDIEGTEVQTIDFWSGLSESPAATVSTLWSATGADPISDLDEAVNTIGVNTALTPDVAILGTDAAKYLINALSANGVFDERRINLGAIEPRDLPDGVRYIGTLRYPSLDLYTYNEHYYNSATSALEPLVPVNKVLIGTARANTTRAYGIVQVFDERNQERWVVSDRVANSWVQRENPVGRVVQMTSRPLLAVHQPQAFRVLTVA